MKVRPISIMFTVLLAAGAFAQSAEREINKKSCDGLGFGGIVTPGFRPVRLLEDSANHRRWLVERSITRPEWPPRAIPVQEQLCTGEQVDQQGCEGDKWRGLNRSIMIHGGDSVLIVEESSSLRAELEAVAVSNGQRGESISVRLRSNGKIVRAVVADFGRVILANPRSEGHR